MQPRHLLTITFFFRGWQKFYGEESTTPIKRHQGHNENSDRFMEKKSIDEAPFDSESGFLLVCDNVEDMLQAQVVNVLVTQCLDRFDILQNINAQSSSRSFDDFDLPYTFCKVLGSVCSDLTPSSDVIEAHLKQLKRNLAAFDLEIDAVAGDGDCAFRSIIRQLYKVVPNMTEAAKDHIRFLGLLNSEDKDIFFTLRQKFVDRMLEPDEELTEFMRSTDCITLARNTEDFRSPGFYHNELGDFVMKVASSILRIPIVIVSSNEAAHCIPFVPPDPILKEPLYVAFTSYGPGHYDSTRPVTVVGKFSK